jgi:hypothetical protein
MTTPAPGVSRRALFGLGGAALVAAGAATAWRLRSSSAEAATPVRADAPIPYADHDGWMVSIAEKQALRAGAADPAADAAGAGR